MVLKELYCVNYFNLEQHKKVFHSVFYGTLINNSFEKKGGASKGLQLITKAGGGAQNKTQKLLFNT